ncbi:MAG: hypothetical protein V1911_00900 [Candidatus Micrarchaeota archaeon]
MAEKKIIFISGYTLRDVLKSCPHYIKELQDQGFEIETDIKSIRRLRAQGFKVRVDADSISLIGRKGEILFSNFPLPGPEITKERAREIRTKMREIRPQIRKDITKRDEFLTLKAEKQALEKKFGKNTRKRRR